MTDIPETQYLLTGGVHLAYQVLGDGPPTVVGVNAGPGTHMDFQWEEPRAARWLRGFAEFCRLVIYDNRGVGLSDPVPVDALPTMDEQVDDIRAVMDAAGVQRAVISGHVAGCAPAMVFAATHPERVESLVLMGGYATMRSDDSYPVGVDPEQVEQISAVVLAGWGSGQDLAMMDPSVADDEQFRKWYARMERMAASPGTAAAMARQWFEVDVRSVLPSINVPTLIIGRESNPLFPKEHAMYLAEHIKGARYVEFPGSDLHYFTADADAVLRTIQEFVTGAPPPPS